MRPPADDVDLSRLEAASGTLAARLIAGALTPANVVGVLTFFVAIRHSSSTLTGVGWAVLTIILVVGLSYLVLFRALRSGKADDRQVVRRSQRPALMLAALGCIGVALLLLALFGAPRALVVLVIAMGCGLAAMAAVTLVWKASMHMAVAAGAFAIACLEEPRLWPLAALFPVLGWARWRDGRHSGAQLLGGTVIGAVAAATVYGLFR